MKAERRSRRELELQRRVGIKTRVEFERYRWWTRDFISCIERAATPKQISAAKNRVRSGRVLEMNVNAGVVEARVQGRRKLPYCVRIYSASPTEAQLTGIKRRLGKRAINGALLLSGEMPPDMREIFASEGAALAPEDCAMGRLLCGCPEPGGVCEHIVAVLCVLTEAFDRDPFLLLKFRGLEKDDLLHSLTGPVGPTAGERPPLDAQLSGDERGPVITESCGESEEMAAPVSLGVSFYGSGQFARELASFRDEPPDKNDSKTARAAMFDFPFWRGETSFMDSIEPYYDSVAKFLRGK
jgi:uncharacterized Zn finger protein